jgi:hypothetical protein
MIGDHHDHDAHTATVLLTALARIPGTLSRTPASPACGGRVARLGWRCGRSFGRARELHQVGRAAGILYLAVPFFLAGASSLPGSSGAVAFMTSSANLRWLANSCSAKS